MKKLQKDKPIQWHEGMIIKPHKRYIMSGKDVVDMGFRIDYNGYLVATTLSYTVQIAVPKWIVEQYKTEQTT